VAALIPVGTLMFRFDNPDALLVLFAKLRPVADTARATYRSDWAGTAPGQQITLNFDIKLIVASSPAERSLDLGELTTAIEDFNSIFIRLPSVRRFSFSTLSALHTLSRRGPLRLTDLTATEQLKQPTLTALVAKLERDGLVKRRRDPRDGRAVLLSLTPEGQEIVRSRHADRMEGLSRLAEGLNDQERDALTGYARVLGRLTEIAAAGDGRGTQGDQRRVHADTSVPPRPGAGPRARRRA
jgi:DNA-binding MarR family transcriptional regulator